MIGESRRSHSSRAVSQRNISLACAIFEDGPVSFKTMWPEKSSIHANDEIWFWENGGTIPNLTAHVSLMVHLIMIGGTQLVHSKKKAIIGN